MIKLKITTILSLLYLVISSTYGQITVLDQWERINDGFAKCVNIGESSGEAEWFQDDFEVKHILDKNGQIYAYIEYDAYDHLTPTNPAICTDGFFKFDSVTSKWTKVSNKIPSNGYGSYYEHNVITNHFGIFYVEDGGKVYELTENYATYPDGWKQISKDYLINSQVYQTNGAQRGGN